MQRLEGAGQKPGQAHAQAGLLSVLASEPPQTSGAR